MATPEHERAARIAASANFEDGVVKNIVATPKMEKPFALENMRGMLGTATEYLKRVERVPKVAPETVRPQVDEIAKREAGLRVTWLGHSTMLVAIDGALVLTDPVFSERVSPVSFAGPKRFYAPPLALDELPPLDAVVLSHDHYDHLDKHAILQIAKHEVPLFVPLGVGHDLESWGIPSAQIVEHDWWDKSVIPGTDVEVTFAPSRHFSGRNPTKSNRTLWGSWAIVGPEHRAWFSGDTGPFDDGVREIRKRLGPFDLSMVESGAWHESWGEIHLGPQQAMKMHELVGAKLMLPVHWGTFNLALHAWDEPIVHLMELGVEEWGSAGLPQPGRHGAT